MLAEGGLYVRNGISERIGALEREYVHSAIKEKLFYCNFDLKKLDPKLT